METLVTTQSTLGLKAPHELPRPHYYYQRKWKPEGKENISNTLTGPSVPIKNRKAITESEQSPEL